MRTILLAFATSIAIAFAVSVVLTRLIRDLAHRLHLYDAPTGGRKIHQRPVPRLGGIAVAVGSLVPFVPLLVYSNKLTRALWSETSLLLALGLGGAIVFLVGLADDLLDVRARYKFLGQILAGAVVAWAGVRIDAVALPGIGVLDFAAWHLAIPLTIFWVVLVTNSINLIDGLDGLAGGVAATAGLAMLLMSLLEGDAVTALILAAVVGATLGFLVFNRPPASIFLGDAGSLLLGFLLATVAVHANQKSTAAFSLLAALLVFGLPIFDLGMAVVRRALLGRPLFAPDQHHVHHRLLQRGLDQVQSVRRLLAAAAVLAALALLLMALRNPISALCILVAVVGPALVLAIRYLGYDQLIRSGRRSLALSGTREEVERRLDAVRRFGELLPGSGIGALQQHLAEVGRTLGLDAVEVRLPGGAGRFAWSASTGGPAEGVHLEDVRHLAFDLWGGEGEAVFAWRCGRGVLEPVDEALVRCLAFELERWRPHGEGLPGSSVRSARG